MAEGTEAQEPLLKPEEVASVLSGNESEPAKGEEGELVYSLRRPVAIAPENEPVARRQMERLAAALETTLRQELDTEITAEIQGFQQEQAGAAVKTLPEPAWILSFLDEDGGGLALALDPTCALSLVELALGGAGNSSASGREPTPLEGRVMDNMCATVLGPLARAADVKFSRGVFTKRRLPDALATPGQTVGVGLLKLTLAETDRSGLVLATPNMLKDPEGKKPEVAPSIGPMAAPLEKVPMVVRPVLKAGLLSVSELMALEPGSVLQLDLSATTPLDLTVNGRDLFKGEIVPGEDGAVFRVQWRRGRRMTARADEENS